MLIDAERDVDASLVDQLIIAAQWAPNHKRTWPARFCVVTGDSRAALGGSIADAMAAHGDDAAKVAKTRTKYTRSPVCLVVASVEGESARETEENRYAVAAGVQNALLMAHAHGLAALWGSPAKGANTAITEFAGFDVSDHVIGIVYLGWPSQESPVVDRPAARVTRRD
jgi:nitroreductase